LAKLIVMAVVSQNLLAERLLQGLLKAGSENLALPAERREAPYSGAELNLQALS
jgi:hypothetical protein